MLARSQGMKKVTWKGSTSVERSRYVVVRVLGQEIGEEIRDTLLNLNSVLTLSLARDRVILVEPTQRWFREYSICLSLNSHPQSFITHIHFPRINMRSSLLYGAAVAFAGPATAAQISTTPAAPSTTPSTTPITTPSTTRSSTTSSTKTSNPVCTIPSPACS